ncbi:hypothetical protein ANANG_G00074380 [Anguilla anguilla]|uniref:Uncharacterized protein n=1 Tax=Anguilla anguilla TaxID=7936 RepID=A0A9D3S273_ANGAN|nr:hypothetical protein ANANG_G00074380 [Anguilla anguilla]
MQCRDLWFRQICAVRRHCACLQNPGSACCFSNSRSAQAQPSNSKQGHKNAETGNSWAKSDHLHCGQNLGLITCFAC